MKTRKDDISHPDLGGSTSFDPRKPEVGSGRHVSRIVSLSNLSGHISTAARPAGRPAGGPPGPALSPGGVAQAEDLAQRTAHLRLAAVYTSPMERAVQTARIVAGPRSATVIEEGDDGRLRRRLRPCIDLNGIPFTIAAAVDA